MKSIEAVIFVEPTAKGRPRSTVISGHVSTYTPAKTRKAEALICAMIREQVMAAGCFPAGMPLRIDATFYIPKPPSAPKRLIFPVKKPDVDNYQKLLQDALEKFVYPVDSQIVTSLVKKRYAAPGATPRIEVKIREEVEL